MTSLVLCAPLVACKDTDGTGDTNCPNDLPTCPSTAPSSASVEPILENKCRTCHTSNGVASSVPLDTYSQQYQERGEMLHQVYSCLMPDADGGTPLTSEERSALLTWLVCGAPQ